MARARNIKPGFFANEELVELPFSTRLLFIGLWTIADRAGRLEDRPKRIKMALFPADDFNIDEALNALQTSGFVLRYEIDEGKYIQILAFEKHQNPHKDEKASSIPAPLEHGAGTVQTPCKHGDNRADSPIPDSLNTDSQMPSKTAVELFDGVNPQVAADFKSLRAKLKAPITKTAIAGIQREADIAGISLEAALTTCIERSWRGFKAAWLHDSRSGSPQSLESRNKSAIADWVPPEMRNSNETV